MNLAHIGFGKRVQPFTHIEIITVVESRSQHLRILHLDDNEDDRIITKYHLSKLSDGIEVIWAESVNEALEIISSNEIDAILCDYQMPQRDGLEFIDELRSEEVDIPVIMLTGNGDDTIANRAFELGVDDYFTKLSGEKAYERVLSSVFTLVDSYTNRKNSQRLMAEYRQLFEENVSGAFEISRDGRFIKANSSLKSILGFEGGDIPPDFRFSSLFERPSEWQEFKGMIELEGKIKKKLVTIVDRLLQAKNVIIQANKTLDGTSVIGTIRPDNSKSVRDGSGHHHKFSLEYYINATVAPLCYFVLDQPIPVSADTECRARSIEQAILADCNESFTEQMNNTSRAGMIGESFSAVFNGSRFDTLRDTIRTFCSSEEVSHQYEVEAEEPVFTTIFSVRREGMILGFWGSLAIPAS